MKFTISLAKMQCELTLDEQESSQAQKELYQFLVNLKPKDPDDWQRFSKSNVNSLLISQHFNIGKIVDCLEKKNKNGAELNGALFNQIVKQINQKKLFGDETFNFDRFIFEIYDNYFQEYCVILNANMPIPNQSTIRIKPNKISENFQYNYEDIMMIDSGNNDKQDNKVNNKDNNNNNGTTSNDSKDIKTVRRSRVLIFSNSNMKNNNNSNNNGNSNNNQQHSKYANENGDNRFRRQNNNQHSSSKVELRSNDSNQSEILNLKSIVRSDYLLFKSIIRCLYNDKLFESVKKRMSNEEENTNDNTNDTGNNKQQKSRKEQQQLKKNKIIEMIWSKVVKNVGRDGFSTIRIIKCQHLFHQCVCQGYLQTLERNDSFSKACQSFELFNFIHGKIMAIHYRLEELELPGNNLCGQCSINMFAIKRARIAFREKQRVNNNNNNNTNISNDSQLTIELGNSHRINNNQININDNEDSR